MAHQWHRERARLAVTTRHHGADAPQTQEARRDLRASRAEDYIRDLVASAPPLTTAQRDRLVVLLRTGANA